MPFAYAVGALWRRDLTSWIQPVLPWAFFAVGILGAGILMGGAWAYEALSFGGFWAWDPVENSSLVPWMVLVAAAHLLLINRNRKQPTALFSTVYLSILSFLLVLYSTFLTKSGVLGDTSVHSFVDSGILPQLLAYLLRSWPWDTSCSSRMQGRARFMEDWRWPRSGLWRQDNLLWDFGLFWV